MKDKVITAIKAASLLKSNDFVMIGGFLAVGTPVDIIEELLKTDVKDLTLIATTTAFADKGCGQLVVAKKIKKAIVSHIGTNVESVRQYISGEMEVELSPLGTLVERVRAGGFGLGGIITVTGIGTEIEKGKQKIIIDGKEFLVEKPLRANVAYIKGYKADKNGNIICRKSARNFNVSMPFAADICVAEVEEIVEIGELDPDLIHIPHTAIDYIVKAR